MVGRQQHPVPRRARFSRSAAAWRSPAPRSADLPRDLLTWHANAHVRWAAFGTDSRLYAYRYDLQTLYDITPAGVGALDSAGCGGRLRAGRLWRGGLRHRARSGGYRTCRHIGHHGATSGRWTPSGRICWWCRPRTGICSRWSPLDARHGGCGGGWRTGPEPRRDRHRPAACGAAGGRRRPAQHCVERSGEPQRLGADGVEPRRLETAGDPGLCDDRLQGQRWRADLHQQRRAQNDLCRHALRLRHHADCDRLRADVTACGGRHWFVPGVAGLADVLGLQWKRASHALRCWRLVFQPRQPPSPDDQPGVR